MGLLSLPREHGAYITLLGAGVSALVLAPDRVGVLGVALAFTLAFFVRGPLERRAAGHPLRRWDRPAMALLIGLCASAVWLAARDRPGLLPLLAAAVLALPVTALLARRGRFLRGPGFEMIAMGCLGASAGLAAWRGGLEMGAAACLALVLGAHAAASVPLVRSQVRRRGAEPGLLVAGAAVLAGAGLGVVLLGRPLLLLAFAPRAAGLAASLTGPRHAAAPAVGLEETGLLCLAVALLVSVA
jgi:hypothetical protein